MQEKHFMSKEQELCLELCIRSMQDLRAYAIMQIKKADIIERKPVTLKHGRESDIYVNVKKIYGMPALYGWLGFSMYQLIEDSPTCIAASGYGGIPMACDVARRSELPLSLIRDGERNHGLIDPIIGYTPGPNDKVAIIDDVCTTGKGLERTIGVIRSKGAEISGCYVVVKRGNAKISVPLFNLITLEELLQE